MSAASLQAGSPAAERATRLLLIAAAVIEFVGIPGKLAVLFAGDPEVPGPGWRGLAVGAELALVPLAAVALLYFAMRDRIVPAIVALALIGLLGWAGFLPVVIASPDGFPGSGIPGIYIFVKTVAVPLLAASSIVLALRGERLLLAAILAATPLTVSALGILAFAVGISVYGF